MWHALLDWLQASPWLYWPTCSCYMSVIVREVRKKVLLTLISVVSTIAVFWIALLESTRHCFLNGGTTKPDRKHTKAKISIIYPGNGHSGHWRWGNVDVPPHSVLSEQELEIVHSLGLAWVDILERHLSPSMMHWLDLSFAWLPSSAQLYDTQHWNAFNQD